MKRMKTLICFALALAFLFCACPMSTAFAESSLTAVEDKSSSYTPTQIINGSFEDESPYGSADPNVGPLGVDGGWTTTDNWLERSNWPGTYGIQNPPHGVFFAEMNAEHSACLYQDLSTHDGDIIRWTLHHAARDCGDPVQKMAVYVGASDGNLPSGWDSGLNTHISASTKATYTAEGVTNPEGKTYGYGNASELANLAVPMARSNPWYLAKGIYVIPKGQSVTRFAFVSLCRQGGLGNLLDNITFSTLLGNLSVTENLDGSVTVKGYWGDPDPAKKLIVNLGTEHEIDMTSVSQKNFTVTIPKTLVDTATDMNVYHEDYPGVKKPLSSHDHTWTYDANGATLTAYCSNTDDAKLCFYQGAEHAVSLTVSATSKAYDGKAVVATLSDSTTWAGSGLAVPDIEYYQENATKLTSASKLKSTSTATKLTEAPIAGGSYTARITAGGKTASVAFTISKNTKPAPDGITGTNPTGKNTNDGAITGITDEMEYSTDGGKTWTPFPKGTTEVTGLGPNKYLIRYSATEGTDASEAVEIILALPQGGIPKTGDNSPLLLFSMMLLISGAALMMLLKKQKEY